MSNTTSVSRWVEFDATSVPVSPRQILPGHKYAKELTMDSTAWKVQINTLFTVFFGLAPSNKEFKEILPPKKFFRQNLIFWIVMGCGKAHFDRKGQ